MTQLRDARLQRALDAADEEPSRPQPHTRDAVREAARRAVASKAMPWWRRLWPADRGAARMPWNAAFATVLLAVLVGVLWQDKQVPGVRSDSPVADAPAPAPAATPSPTAPLQPAASAAAPAAEAAPAAGPRPAPAPARAAPPARERLSRDEATEQRLLQRSLEDAAVAQARREAASAEVADAQGAASRSAPAAVAPAAPAPTLSPAPQPAAAPPLAKAAPPTFSQAAPGAGAAAPAQAPAAARAPAARDQAAAPAISWEGWTELRIAADGRELVLSRRRAPQLSELINRAARAAQTAAPTAPAAQGQVPTASYELSTRGTLLAVLEVGDTHARFLPVGESGPSHLVRLDPADLQALREETLKLLPPR